MPKELREIKEVMLEVRDLLAIFVSKADKQVTPGSESTSSSTGGALTDNSTPKCPNKQISLNIRVNSSNGLYLIRINEVNLSAGNKKTV